MGARDDVLFVEVVDGGGTEVLREQALLGGHVHDQLGGGEPVRRDDVEGVVGEVDDGSFEAIRQRQVDVDHRIGGTAPTRQRGVEHALTHASGRFGGFGGAEPRGHAGQAVGFEREVGSARQHGFDGDDLFGIERVEHVRAEQLLDLGIGQLVGHHHSPPSASRVAAIRRSASRRRDLAVPSGMPSVSATCR